MAQYGAPHIGDEGLEQLLGKGAGGHVFQGKDLVNERAMMAQRICPSRTRFRRSDK